MERLGLKGATYSPRSEGSSLGVRSGAPVSEKGFLVTIEGIGGSGKTTLAKGLAEWLVGQRLMVTTTREPGGASADLRLRLELVLRQ
ncbi:MAG TPA: hypothetical protein VFR68_00665, partial [Candidatus Dormibacteraeota bacterium]|nr:hypothetical protein [Candidatus Dormibacteraeota bacterium]